MVGNHTQSMQTTTLRNGSNMLSLFSAIVETPGMPEAMFAATDHVDDNGDLVVELWTRTNPASSGRRAYEQVGTAVLADF